MSVSSHATPTTSAYIMSQQDEEAIDPDSLDHYHDHKTFHNFFESFLVEQSHHLEDLVLAVKENYQHLENQTLTQHELDKNLLSPKIERVIEHYEDYYKTKSRFADDNVFSMFKPSWRSSVEHAFMWIGGWRPSMIFHLLYSKSGLQFESKLDELIQGLSTGDLGDLSSNQLRKVNELQEKTITEEKDMTEKWAKQQETVADSLMVELSHIMTEITREGNDHHHENVDDENVDATLAPKEEAFTELLHMADKLRLKTLKEMVHGILSPLQSVHFLTAAAELHLRIHEWGKKRDASWQGGGDQLDEVGGDGKQQ